MNNQYKKTIAVYKSLGKKYINGTIKGIVKEMPEFISLLPKNALVLDAGCIAGRDAKKFIKAGCRVIGIDLVDEFLAEARKRVPQGKFIKKDLLKLDFPANHFDAIWASAVLLHFRKKDVKKILKKFYKILKTGGKLHVRVKRGYGTKMESEKLSGGQARLFTYFAKKEMADLIKQAGFRIISAKIYEDELRRKEVKWVGVWGEK